VITGQLQWPLSGTPSLSDKIEGGWNFQNEIFCREHNNKMNRLCSQNVLACSENRQNCILFGSQFSGYILLFLNMTRFMRLWNSLQGVGFNFWSHYENVIYRNQFKGSSICHDECTLLIVINKPRRRNAKQTTWTYMAKAIVNIWQNVLYCAISCEFSNLSFKGTRRITRIVPT